MTNLPNLTPTSGQKQQRATRRAAAIAVAAVLLSVAAACGSSDKPGSTKAASTTGPITIGFSPVTMAAPALSGLAKGFESYAKAKGYQTLVADPKGDPGTQVQQLLGWINRGQVQAVWAIAVSPGSLVQVIKAAQSKHVALLLAGVPKDYNMDGPAPGVGFSVVDYKAYGTSIGQLASECINSRFGGAGKVILVTNPVGSQAGNVETEDAIKAALRAGSPNANVVAEVNGQGERLKAQQAVATALQAHQDANTLIGGNDESVLGGLGAFDQAGKTQPGKSCVAGAGGNDEARQAVQAKKIYGDVIFEFDKDLQQNVDLLATMAGNPATAGKQMIVPVTVVKG